MPTTAAALAAQGIKPKYTLPEWARNEPFLLAGPTKPALTSGEIGNASVSGGGTGLLDIQGFYDTGLGKYANRPLGGGPNDSASGADYDGFNELLRSSGQSLYEAGGDGQIARWMQDAQGNVTQEPQFTNSEDKKFGYAAALAAAVTGANLYGAYGGAGAVSSGGGAGAMTAEQVAMLSANGLTDAQIAAMASSLTGAGMGGAAGGAGATAAEEGIKQLGTIAPGSGPVAPLTPTGLEVAPALGSVPAFTGAPVGLSAGEIAAGGAGLVPKVGPGMDASDWIQLAGLGAGLISANNAQGSADAFVGQTVEQASDMLAFSKQQYADSLPFIKAAQEKSLKVADAQLASQAQQDALAKEYADYNRTTFRPLEQGIVADAQGYDTPQKRQSAADQALADVNMQFDARGAATARQLAANGVNPGSARSMSVMGSQGVEQARVGVGAAAQARKGVETTGFARQMDAASLGRNLPSSQATSAGLGIQAGSSAVNTSIAGANAGTQQAGLALNGMQGAGNMNIAAGRLQQGAQDAQTQLWGQLGQTAGRYWGSSDVNMKKDIEPANPEQALQEVTGTPVSNWKYSPAKMAAEGLTADGEQHTGPMAQDVNATMGEQVAPGGKKIDLITMNGKTMLAVQALDKKVNMLAKMLQGGQLQAGAAA